MTRAKAKEVAPGVYQIFALGAAVTVLIDGERVVLLDAGLRISSRMVMDFLGQQGLTGSDVSHILISHGHPDHVGGLARLKAATGAHVGSHAAEARYISGAQPFPDPFAIPVAGRILAPVVRLVSPRPAPVDMLLEDGAPLEVLGGLEVVHTPGHTPGSLSFFLPARGLLFVGDALQHWRSRITPPDPLFTQDMAQAKASIRRLAALDATVICFSHFPPILKGARHALQQCADSLS